MLLFTKYPVRFMWVIEVPTEMQTCLYYIKWENSHLLEGELKRALPGWSQPPELGFSPFNVRPLREQPDEECSLLSSLAYWGRRRHSSSMIHISKGLNCPEETTVAFYRLYREPQVNGLILGQMPANYMAWFWEKWECEHSAFQDASAAPGSWDNPGSR